MKGEVSLTLGVDWPAVRWAGWLSGSGMLSMSSRSPRTFSSEMQRESRGNLPEILNLKKNTKSVVVVTGRRTV